MNFQTWDIEDDFAEHKTLFHSDKADIRGAPYLIRISGLEIA